MIGIPEESTHAPATPVSASNISSIKMAMAKGEKQQHLYGDTNTWAAGIDCSLFLKERIPGYFFCFL